MRSGFSWLLAEWLGKAGHFSSQGFGSPFQGAHRENISWRTLSTKHLLHASMAVGPQINDHCSDLVD
jgi:hypothetical protein